MLTFGVMAEQFYIPKMADKSLIYSEIIPQIESVIEAETNIYANLANVTAMLKEAFGWFWVGFYVVDKAAKQLVLGPFQGTLACTRIRKGKGVCGTCWERRETIVVEDVEIFEGHIACSSLSRSEIVVPIVVGGEVWGVLDVDSESVATFDDEDRVGLGKLGLIIEKMVERCENY